LALTNEMGGTSWIFETIIFHSTAATDYLC
jgi:hypothetical protein